MQRSATILCWYAKLLTELIRPTSLQAATPRARCASRHSAYACLQAAMPIKGTWWVYTEVPASASVWQVRRVALIAGYALASKISADLCRADAAGADSYALCVLSQTAGCWHAGVPTPTQWSSSYCML